MQKSIIVYAITVVDLLLPPKIVTVKLCKYSKFEDLNVLPLSEEWNEKLACKILAAIFVVNKVARPDDRTPLHSVLCLLC